MNNLFFPRIQEEEDVVSHFLFCLPAPAPPPHPDSEVISMWARAGSQYVTSLTPSQPGQKSPCLICAQCMQLAHTGCTSRAALGPASCSKFIQTVLKSIHKTTAGQTGAISMTANRALKHRWVYFKIIWGMSQKGVQPRTLYFLNFPR